MKAIAFEQKAKDIREKLDKKADVEQDRYSRNERESHEHSKHKMRNDSGSEKPSKIRKNVGEEKYEQIYSISQSFGKFDQDFSSLNRRRFCIVHF